jgi:uncharacterized protein
MKFELLRRRDFLKSATAAGLALSGLAASSPRFGSGFVDVNVSLGRWPLRRLAGDDTAELAARLRSQGVTQAWAGSFDGLLHKDLASVNARLAYECRRHGRGILIPFGSVNPAGPDWEEDLQRCATQYRMAGIRLHPNYHGYALDSAAFARLLKRATDLGLIVQIALVMEDERMMHPRLRVEAVDTTPLLAIIKQTPGLRLVLLNALRTLRDQPLSDLVGGGEVSVDIAMLEGVAGVENLLRQISAERVLFGSHAPLFYFESAALKLKESVIQQPALERIRAGNARRILARSGA